MTDAYLTALQMEERIPASHPLRMLEKVTAEVVEGSAARLFALEDSVGEADISRCLKAALLQVYYRVPSYEAFADQIRYNALYRWFLGLEHLDHEWDLDLYERLHRRWTSDQELRQFLLEAAACIKEFPIARGDLVYAEMRNLIEESFRHWINIHCPKAIYFHQFSNSPVKEFALALRFIGKDNPHDPPSQKTEAFAARVSALFPDKMEQTAEEIEFGIDAWKYLSGNKETNLIVDDDAIYLICQPERFESWEDTIKPYLSAVIDGVRANDEYGLLSHAVMRFENVFVLPIEADVSHYFHMLPDPPPLVVPPRLMREQNISYSFPSRMITGNYTTDLIYDSFGQILRCQYEITPVDTGLKVMLGLQSQWHDTFVASEAMRILDDMKNNLYVAFHSLITDRTRSLIE